MGIDKPLRGWLDLYAVLEVSPHASQEVIQAAYRALARTNHPDVRAAAEAVGSTDTGERMRQLNAAYRVLGHTERRARYDLDCARARRLKRTIEQDHRHPLPTVAVPASRVGVLQGAASGRPGTDRFAAFNSGALLVVITAVALTALLLAMVWITLDTARDDASMFGRSLIESSGR